MSSNGHQPVGCVIRTLLGCFFIVAILVTTTVLIIILSSSSESDSYDPSNKNDRFPTLTPITSSDSNGMAPVSSSDGDSISMAYQNWLDTTITLQDGIQYEVVNQISHDSTAFTQGLTYSNGILYESTGLRGKSSIRILNSTTGQVERIASMDGSYFGEGMTVIDGSSGGVSKNFDNPILVQITWTSQTGFIYDAAQLSSTTSTSTADKFVSQKFDFRTTTGEGWGITYNPNTEELIVSDGSNILHFWDPDDFKVQQEGTAISSLRTVSVTRQNGSPAMKLNELEFWRGRILANVWYQDVILVIHPETGVVEKEYDMTSLYPKWERGSTQNVLNGISISSDPDILYVTGKRWDRMFQIKLLPL